MKQTVVVATNNSHKLNEIRAILGDYFDVLSLKDVGLDIDIEETGQTFYENALIKAKTVFDLTGKISIADDSGLMVDALDGKPGVYSARFAGEPCDDAKNNDLLLKMLKNQPNRAAKFVSVIVVYYPNGQIKAATGEAHGTILDKQRGTGGFGYDPLFLSDDLNKTFAELSFDEKNQISHRSRALNQLLSLIKN